MCPWAGGHTDATVTTDTDTGRGLRRGTLQLMMEENPLCIVGHKTESHPFFTELNFFAHSIRCFLPRLMLRSRLRLSPACPICCSRHASSEGAVSVGHGGRRRGAHPPRPVHRAGRNLPQGGRGRRMERDSQVQRRRWPHGLELASCGFYPMPHLSVCAYWCVTASFIRTLHLLHCKLQL